MDVKWTPGSSGAELPRSANYRSKLRELCKILHSGQRLPKTVNKKELAKMCEKLKIDDSNVAASKLEYDSSQVVIILLFIGICWYLWQHHHTIERVMKFYVNRLGNAAGRSTSVYPGQTNNSVTAREERARAAIARAQKTPNSTLKER